MPHTTADREQIPRTDEKEVASSMMMAEARPSNRWEEDPFVVTLDVDCPTLPSPVSYHELLGLEFYLVDSVGGDLVVDGVLPDKLVHQYNRAAALAQGLQVLPGDRLVEVAVGRKRMKENLLKELKKPVEEPLEPDGNGEAPFQLFFQRAVLSSMRVAKGEQKLGLRVNMDKAKPWRNYLQVEAVNEGAIMAFNMNADRTGETGLQLGDKIVQVNDVRGKPDALLKEISRAQVLNLSFIPVA